MTAELPAAAGRARARVGEGVTHAIRKMQRTAKLLRETKTQHEAAIAEAQRTCTHGEVYHAGFVAGIVFDQLPRRVCKLCGLTEQGWTFFVLLAPSATITQDQATNVAHAACYGGET